MGELDAARHILEQSPFGFRRASAGEYEALALFHLGRTWTLIGQLVMATDAPDPNIPTLLLPTGLEEAECADDEADAGLDGDTPARPPAISRSVGRAVVIIASLILCVVLAVAAAVGWTRSTWTYGATTVDRNTSQRLARLADDLAQAGAPQVAVAHVAAASQPGINIGDALEALATAQMALAGTTDSLALLRARAELNIIYSDLYMHQYGRYPMPQTPHPTRPTPSQSL